MGEPRGRVDRELEASVQRILGTLERLPASRATESAATGASPFTAREGTRAGRRLERQLRKEDEASVPHAFVFGGAAALAAFVGFTQPHLFWLIFVALGLGIAAADMLGSVRRRDRRLAEEARSASTERFRAGASSSEAPVLLTFPPLARPESPAVAAITARESRVDGICDRLLSELKGGPPLLRELLRNPEETIEALRAASRELARRERNLRTALTEEEGERLDRERAALSERVDETSDAVVRERLAGALAALDSQLTHRAELSTAVDRIEAEGTRVLYSLESLRAQVLRALAADSAASEVTKESLKGGLETLSAEIDAVATALEEVHGVGSPAVSSASSPNPASRAARRQAVGSLLVLLLVPPAALLGDPVSVPGGPAAIRRLLDLGERRPDGDFFPDVVRVLLSGSDPHASWEDSNRRRAVVSFAEDLAEWKAAQGCPAILSTRPEAWDATRRALKWLGFRVRGEGPEFEAEPQADAESLRRQAFLDVLGQPTSEALRKLVAGEDVRVSCPDGEVELPFGLAAWRETLGVDEKRLNVANAFLHFVKSVPASRMMWALHAVDARTREELRSLVGPAGGHAGWKLLYDEALDGFATYPEAVEIRAGRFRLPGGDVADPIWEEVVGTPPSDRARFVVRFFDAGGGKAAYVADALRQLPEATARVFVLGRTSEKGKAVERFRRFYDAIGPGGRTFRTSSRDPYDLTHFANFLTLSADGEIVPPGGVGLWLEALETSRFPADEADLAELLADAAERREGPDDLLEQLLRRDVAGALGPVPARKPFITVSSLIRARPVLADPGSILLLFCGHERFHSSYAPLEDLPLEDPAIVRRYLFTLDRLDTNGTDRDAELRAGLFQASVELLSALTRSGSLPDSTARDLFRTLLDVPLFATPRTEVSSGIGDFDRWLHRGLLGVLREEEARFLGKMRTEALARDPDHEGPPPARTSDGLVAAALAGWRAPAVFAWRGGSYLYDPTADGAARRRAFAATQEHVPLAALSDVAALRERALESARKGDAAATRTAVGALLESLAASPSSREADEKVQEIATGGRHTLLLLHSVSGGDVLPLLEAGIGQLDALWAERMLGALAVHVYSSSVLEPDDLPFTDALLVQRHSFSWDRRVGFPVVSPFGAVRIESPGAGAPLRLAGTLSGLAAPLGLLHAEGLVYDARSFIANDGIRSGLVVPVALLVPARLDDEALRFVALACQATEQLAAALEGLPENDRHEAWNAVARDLVPAFRRNRLAEQKPVQTAEHLSPSDLLRIGRRLVLRTDASLPRVPAAEEAHEVWARLVGRFGEAGASARVAEVGSRPFHWAGLGRLADVDLPSYERLSEYRRPQLFADHLHDLKIAVARSVFESGDPAALVPLFLEPALDGLLRRARMAFAFDWRSLADPRRSLPSTGRDDVLGAALADGWITRSETSGTR